MKTLLLLALTLPALASASIFPNRPPSEEVLKSIRCRTEAEKTLAEFLSKNLWLRSVDSGQSKVFRTPTYRFGRWVELKYDQTKNPVITEIFDTGYTVVTFSREKCEKSSSIIKSKRQDDFVKAGDGTRYFTDQDLDKVLKSGKPGFVYMWSPNLVYSVAEVGKFRNVARKLGLTMIEVMDPAVTQDRTRFVLKSYKQSLNAQKNDSIELALRGGQIHFPTAFVFAKGRLSDFPLIGVMEEPVLEKAISWEYMILNGGTP